MMKINVFLIALSLIPFCRSLEGIVNINLIRDKCFHQSLAQIIRCQLTFTQNINTFLDRRPLSVNLTDISDGQLKIVCCGLWDMTSCMKRSVVKWSSCNPSESRTFIKDLDQLKHRTEYRHCYKHYRQGSINCGFPVWATITLVGVSIVLVAVISCFVHRFCSRRSTNPDSINLIEH